MFSKKISPQSFPKWMEFAIVITAIIMVMVVGYYWQHTQEAIKSHPIGQFDNRKMSEKIDQNADNGILPIFYEGKAL